MNELLAFSGVVWVVPPTSDDVATAAGEQLLTMQIYCTVTKQSELGCTVYLRSSMKFSGRKAQVL